MEGQFVNPYPNPAPKKKTSALRVIAFVLLGVTGLVCGISVIAVALSGPKPVTVTAPPIVAEATPTAAAPPAVAKTPDAPKTPAAPAAPQIADGTWTVGEDFPAGTYKTVGASETCYWSITKSGTNGEDIINNHLGGGNLRVTLKSGQDFETKRCGTWQKA